MNKLSRLCYTLVNYWQLGGVCKCMDNPKALYMDEEEALKPSQWQAWSSLS